MLTSLMGTQAIAQNNQLSFTNNDGTTTRISQQADDLEVTVEDMRGVSTRYRYNRAGQLLSEHAPEQGTLVYRYDDQGRPFKVEMEGGVSSTLTFDEQHRVTRQVWQEGSDERILTRYRYDGCDNGEGKLCRVRHNGNVVKYDYNIDGQLTSVRTRLEDENATESLRYSYDDSGRLSAMRYPRGLKVTYNYNADGKVEKVSGVYETGEDRERFIIIKAISYDEMDRVLGFTHGNGIRTNYKYDDDGRLKRITRKKNGIIIERDVYNYDADGRIEDISRLNSALSRQYGYDGQGRLVSEVHGDGTADGSTTLGYTYDEVGNRLTRTVDGNTHNYSYAPDANQLVQVGRQDIAYDVRGNLVEDRQGSRSFTYDLTNRMSAFYRDGQLRAEYDYDARGRRIRKRLHREDTDGTKSVRFIYDTDGRLVSETSRRSDHSAVRARDLIWLGSIAVAQVDRRVKADGSTRHADVLFLQTDHLGAPRTATNESGTAVWYWHGDAFGAKAGNTPAIDRDPDGDGQKTEVSLRFPGQYHDRESGLWYNHHRDYDPKLGRYIQSDPIGLRGGINRYAYVGGDPVQWIDPNGLYRYCVQTSGGVARDTGGDWTTGAGTGTSVRFSRQYCFDINPPSWGPTTPSVITPVTPVITPPPPPPPPPEEDEEELCTPVQDAIADAVREAFEQVGIDLIEHGGLIFQRADGSFGYTTVTGTFSNVDIFSPNSMSQVPAGATVVAGWHTHPHGTYIDGSGNTIRGGDYFSPDDYSVAGRRDRYNNPIPGWEGLGLGLYRGGGVSAFMLPADAAGSGTFSWANRYDNAIDITRCGSGS